MNNVHGLLDDNDNWTKSIEKKGMFQFFYLNLLSSKGSCILISLMIALGKELQMI